MPSSLSTSQQGAPRVSKLEATVVVQNLQRRQKLHPSNTPTPSVAHNVVMKVGQQRKLSHHNARKKGVEKLISGADNDDQMK